MRYRFATVSLLIGTIFLGTAVAAEDTFSLLKLGRGAAKAGNLDEAERYHRLAVTVAEQTGDPVQIAEAIGDLGGILLARWRLSEAKELCLKSLALLRSIELKRYRPVVLNNLGVVSMHQGEYEQSEAYFKESLRVVRSFPSPDPYEARVLNNFGAFYYTSHDLGKAEKMFKEAISVTEKLRRSRAASIDRYVLLDAQDWMNDKQLNELWGEIISFRRA